MWNSRLALLLWAVLVPGQVLAQGQLICQSSIGWCPVAEAGDADDSSLCACRDGETVLPGTRARVATVNPFTELQAHSDEATRALPQFAMASRSFAGPGQMPPDAFQAYGVVVFKSRASRFDFDRHLLICEAYANTLVHGSEMTAPQEDQMVTIWPVGKDAVADEINAIKTSEACDLAVDNYGLVHAQNALKILESYQTPEGPYDTGGRGPFLIAWTPGSKIMEPGTVALMVDLSDVESHEDAVNMFALWRDKIQANQELWREEVVEPGLIDAIRKFFDTNGAILTSVSAQ